MDKSYIIVTSTAGNEKNPCSLVGYRGFDNDFECEVVQFTDLSPEDEVQVRQQIIDAIGFENASYITGKNPDFTIFKLRKDARRVCAQLNKEWAKSPFGGFVGRILEVGDPTPRDVRPVLHWIVEYDFLRSGWQRSEELRADFPNRRLARTAIKEECNRCGIDPKKYRAAPVYGAYRLDGGELRFRTQKDVHKFARYYGYDNYTVTLWDEPVPEDMLYVP